MSDELAALDFEPTLPCFMHPCGQPALWRAWWRNGWGEDAPARYVVCDHHRSMMAADAASQPRFRSFTLESERVAWSGGWVGEDPE